MGEIPCGFKSHRPHQNKAFTGSCVLTHGLFLYFRNTTCDFLHDWAVSKYRLRHTKERLLCDLEKENKVVNCKQFVNLKFIADIGCV